MSGTRFVAASVAQERELIASGVHPDAVAVVYSGIEVERFAPRSSRAARHKLGLPPDRPLVLVPARLHPMKGHIDLLAAMPTLLAHVPDALAMCAGDGPLRRILPAVAAAAGLSDHVRFIGQRSDMPDLMAAADVVALPSHVEGLPSVVLEAFAADRPVVATSVGGVPEVVEDGRTGWLVPPHAPRALAGAIADALTDPDARRARAACGRQTVAERFRAEDAARRMQEAYDRWLHLAGASRSTQGGIAPAVS
jgi:glycosyltransferase involved in cell wall biosynthesis